MDNVWTQAGIGAIAIFVLLQFVLKFLEYMKNDKKSENKQTEMYISALAKQLEALIKTVSNNSNVDGLVSVMEKFARQQEELTKSIQDLVISVIKTDNKQEIHDWVKKIHDRLNTIEKDVALIEDRTKICPKIKNNEQSDTLKN